ncbi:MAG: hypothetical protein RR547_01600 [Raoultibacter sp.]
MDFVLTLTATAFAVVLLAGVIRKVPWLFYGLAAAATVVLGAGTCGLFDGGWLKPLILLVKRCMAALSLFAVVMFVGVPCEDSKLGMRLRPVRSELLIIAVILCLGHVF